MLEKMIITTGLRTNMTAGVCAERNEITFLSDFPGSNEVSLILYKKGTEKILKEIPLPVQPFEGSRRVVKLSGVPVSSLEYNYRVDGKVTQDSRAVIVVGRGAFGSVEERTEHQIRCGLPGPSFDWGEDKAPDLAWEDVISYGLHVRGFTKDPRSGVRHKGTFKGLEEKIPYLQELGINQVVLMPAYEFEDAVPMESAAALPSYVPEDPALSGNGAKAPKRKCNYWGFSKSCYFAPKMAFSSGKRPDVEMKNMVRAMHSAGIEVILEMAFPDDLDGGFLIDCLCWWVLEYHIDGFMLLTGEENARMLAGIPALSGVKLLTGYFDADRIEKKRVRRDSLGRPMADAPKRRLADCHDGFRIDARKLLKGDENQLAAFVSRVRDNNERKAVVNRMAGHDGFTLMDLVSYDKKYNEENGEENRDGAACEYSWNCGVEGPTRKKPIISLRHRQICNALAMLLLSQGTPMIWAGDELGNSQMGNNNPWCIDSPVTWVNWQNRRGCEDIFTFTKSLIALRKAHPILHSDHYLEGTDRTSCGYPDFSCHGERAWFESFEYQSRHVGLLYCGLKDGANDFVYVGYNLHWDPQTVALPYLPDGLGWKRVLCTASEEEAPQANPSRTLELPGRSICVLVGEKGQPVKEEAEE